VRERQLCKQEGSPEFKLKKKKKKKKVNEFSAGCVGLEVPMGHVSGAEEQGGAEWLSAPRAYAWTQKKPQLRTQPQ
jgi:hypothetical protein